MADTLHLPQEKTLAALRDALKRRDIDVFLLPRYDAHQGEYVADHDARLAYVTGFSGSAGMAIITADEAAIFVDGRYSVQVQGESPSPLFRHFHIFDHPPEEYLATQLKPGCRVGLDHMHWPPVWAARFEKSCADHGAELVAMVDNPVDEIWADQPPVPQGQITTFPLQFAGRTTAEKSAELAAALCDLGAQWHVETQPDNIAWFLNVRGADTDYIPVPNSFFLLRADGTSRWFVPAAKFAEGVVAALPDTVQILPVDQFLLVLEQEVRAGDTALIDPSFSPLAAKQALIKAGARICERPSVITLTKAQKNRAELEGMRACHVQDGVAWTEFSAWLSTKVPACARAGDPVTEREAEEKILSLRRQRPGFLGNSFHPISAASANGAMCHYATSEGRNAPILPDAPYLLDSGGQYDTGTTDATRSFSFGARPVGYDRAYTAVFKAFHALATLRFPPGTKGHHIDAICRRPLWDLGLDYDHGTGHGVGHRLSVHEHPQRIGKPVNDVDLVAGMVMSIEPGHYVAGLYGIRIENLFAIVQEDDGFLTFENLTWAPIQTDMLQMDLLTKDERAWLERYHQDLAETLKPWLSDAARSWLGA